MTEFEEKIHNVLLVHECTGRCAERITRIFLDTVLKAIGEPENATAWLEPITHTYSKRNRQSKRFSHIEIDMLAEERNKFRAKIKAKVFEELGIKEE